MTQPAEDQNAAPEEPRETTPAPDSAALEQRLAEANDKLLRTLADAENLRRRTAREREDTAKFAVSAFARDLLAVADNLFRALSAITPEQRAGSAALKNIYDGVDMTAREMLRVLESHGVKRLDPLPGASFDPNLHEVMFEADAPPGTAPGTIMQVLDAGYTIHERLLRPARVGVARGGAGEGARVDENV